jgi:class 3 adenylate cyclase
LPAGTVTFLFTNIADSTDRWEEDSTAMAEALRVHDAIVRSSVECHGG